MKVSTLFSLSLIAFSFIACSKKGSTSTVATAATTYYVSSGLCYNNSNVQVDYSYCNASTSYHLTGGLCYNSSNVQVDYSLCSTSYYLSNGLCYNSSNVQVSTTLCTGASSSASSCSGLYYYIDYYGNLYKVTCDGVANTGNCSGYDLIQGSTGNYVYCN
jgi:hypothetical protein